MLRLVLELLMRMVLRLLLCVLLLLLMIEILHPIVPCRGCVALAEGEVSALTVMVDELLLLLRAFVDVTLSYACRLLTSQRHRGRLRCEIARGYLGSAKKSAAQGLGKKARGNGLLCSPSGSTREKVVCFCLFFLGNWVNGVGTRRCEKGLGKGP